MKAWEVVATRLHRKWASRAYQWLRWSRALAYMSISGAGLFAIVAPPPSVAHASGSHIITYVWAGIMSVSAAMCALGSVAGRWVGEYSGLIPLSLVSAVFGISALARGNASIAGGLFLIGFFWMLISRWQEVALLRIESARRRAHESEMV